MFFYRTSHKNVLHLHEMISNGALFHYILGIAKRTDHINISCLYGQLLRELLNWLVLLLVKHTCCKNLFLFLLSYMMGSIFGIVVLERKIFSHVLCMLCCSSRNSGTTQILFPSISLSAISSLLRTLLDLGLPMPGPCRAKVWGQTKQIS